MIKIIMLTFLFSFSVTADAALACKGSAYGLNSVYTFKKTNNKDLSLSIKITMRGEAIIDKEGVAIYTSKVKVQKMELESYYYFVHGNGSYTELISIQNNFKSMATSRPTSGAANFKELLCSGSI
jgi:hypothetical protein